METCSIPPPATPWLKPAFTRFRHREVKGAHKAGKGRPWMVRSRLRSGAAVRLQRWRRWRLPSSFCSRSGSVGRPTRARRPRHGPSRSRRSRRPSPSRGSRRRRRCPSFGARPGRRAAVLPLRPLPPDRDGRWRPLPSGAGSAGARPAQGSADNCPAAGEEGARPPTGDDRWLGLASPSPPLRRHSSFRPRPRRRRARSGSIPRAATARREPSRRRSGRSPG